MHRVGGGRVSKCRTFPSWRIRAASAHLRGPPLDHCIFIGAASELFVKVGAAEMAAGCNFFEQLQVQIDHLRVEVHRNVGQGPVAGWWAVVAHTSSFSQVPGSNLCMS